MHYRNCCLILFCLLLQQVYAQNTLPEKQAPDYIFHHLNNSNGLVSNQVFCVAQDKKGYIWIGTTKGLQRYDGQRFKNYTDTGVGINESLVTANIFPDDASNSLLYNQFNSRARQRKMLSNQSEWLLPADAWKNNSGQVYTDKKDNNWQLQLYLTSKTSPDGNITEGVAIVKEYGKPLPYFAIFINDKQHKKIWVYETTHGLLTFNEEKKIVCTADDPVIDNPLLLLVKTDQLYIRKIGIDSHGNIWAISWLDWIYRYNTADQSLHKYSVTNLATKKSNSTISGWATAMLNDNHGNFWIATGRVGLLRYNFKEDNFSVITCRPGDNLSIQYNLEINSLFQDREENIWAGTDKGISIFNPYHQYFTVINKQAFAGNEISSVIQKNNGELVVGSLGNGVNIYDKQLNYKSSVAFKSHDENLVWSMQQDNDDNTWAGCQHGFVHLLSPNHSLIETFHPSALENSTVRCMQKDKDGNIYFGLHNGKIAVYNKINKEFLAFSNELQPAGQTLSTVMTIYFDKEGNCWAGTENGVSEFDINKHCFKAAYKPVPGMPAACHSMLQYNDSSLLLGMENAGLFFFNTHTKIFTKIPVNMQQPFWSAQAVGKDNEGNIWFTTDYTICKYNVRTHVLLTCKPGLGLINAAFQPGALLQQDSGKWFSWTATELMHFNPGYLTAQQNAGPGIIITGLKIMDKSLPSDSMLYSNKPIQLSHKENFLSIEFSNLQFSDAIETKYYYRLTGIDKDWVYAGAEAAADYTNLPPGSYNFKVTTGSPGNKNNTASLDIIITPPFWETPWFRILSIAAVCLLIVVLVGWYISNIRREASLKEEIAKTEMMALRAQMNPHFIFNCINSIDALIQCDDKYQATVYLSKFAKLIRGILDSSKQPTISIKRDLETLQLYVELERLRQSNKFIAEIRTADTVLKNDFKVPPLIIQPYVENAILHGLRNKPGNNGKLTIDIFIENDQLVYIIEDNGVGRMAAENTSSKYRSYGMEMSRDRLKLFNKEADLPVLITDLEHNGKASGTRVQVSLKIKYA